MLYEEIILPVREPFSGFANSKAIKQNITFGLFQVHLNFCWNRFIIFYPIK
jgi:hypothetical protein